jgi:hypothetical protein
VVVEEVEPSDAAPAIFARARVMLTMKEGAVRSEGEMKERTKKAMT